MEPAETSESSTPANATPERVHATENSPNGARCGGASVAQVMQFLTCDEAEAVLQSKKLERVPLSDLRASSDLERGYVTGYVTAQSWKTDPATSEPSIELLLSDESSSDNYLTCHVGPDLAAYYPKLPFSNYQLYLHHAHVQACGSEFSQELGVSVMASGQDAHLIVVHRYAGNRKSLRRMRQKMNKKKRSSSGWRDALQAGVGSPPGSSPRKDEAMPVQQGESLEEDITMRQGESSSRAAQQPSDASHESESESSCSSSSEGGEEPPQKRRRKEDVQYEYKKIVDLSVGDRKVNVFGVVSDFKPTFEARSQSFCSSFSIIDESSPDSDVHCVLFNDKERLPQIESSGDIVILHRVHVNQFNGRPSIEGAQYSSSLCFSGRPGASLRPRTGTLTYSYTSADRRRVKELREWAERRAHGLPATRQLCDVTPGAHGLPATRRLCDVSPRAHFNLLCQVVSVTQCQPQCDITILSVWDGSTLPMKPRSIDFSLYNTIRAQDARLGRAAQSLEAHIECRGHMMEEALRLVPGQYLVVCGVSAATVTVQTGLEEYEDQMQLSCVPDSSSPAATKFQLLDADFPPISDLRGRLQALVESVCPESVTQTTPICADVVTTILHSQRPVTSLRCVKASKTVPRNFRCQVRVLEVCPSSAEEIVQVRCPKCGNCTRMEPDSCYRLFLLHDTPCKMCNSATAGGNSAGRPTLTYHFAFKMLLSDDSESIIAYTTGEDARRFLGIAPTNFFMEQQTRQQLVNRLYYLTGGNDPFVSYNGHEAVEKSRPLIDCCIHASHFQDRVVYRIFDTALNYPQ